MGNSKSKLTATEEVLEKGLDNYVAFVTNTANEQIEYFKKMMEETNLETGNGSTTSTTNSAGNDEKSIANDYDLTELHELGLGRGVDGTAPRPWINKTAFQVRKVKRALNKEATTSEGADGEDSVKPKNSDEDGCNILCTNEGGTVHDFSEQVTSIREHKIDLKVSVTPPNAPVELSVGADLSRTYTSTQRALGRRILTKTIAFKPTFDSEFEEKLEDKLKELSKLEGTADEFSVCNCEAFLNRYRVTHYVSSITLGASKFIVESESEYIRSLGIKPVAEGKSLVNFVPSGSYIQLPSATISKQLIKNARNIHYIGRFESAGKSSTDGAGSVKNKSNPEEDSSKVKVTVPKKGINDDGEVYEVKKEAVVLVRLEPITTLLTTKRLKENMEEALKQFIDKHRQKREGPYFISCKDTKVYLKVVEDQHGHAEVYATKDVNEASEFYILLTDDGDHPFEFYIGWRWQSKEKGKVDSTMRYLTAPVSVYGNNSGPLCLESRAQKLVSLFSINNRTTDPLYRLSDEVNVDPKVWFEGEESYLIRCTRRFARLDGFLAVERNLRMGPNQYKLTARRNPRGHDGTALMAFRLHYKDNWNKLPNYVPPSEDPQPTARCQSPERKEASSQL